VLERVSRAGAAPSGTAPVAAEAEPRADVPRRDDPDPTMRVQRESLKAVIQSPGLVGPLWDTLDPELFTHPAYRACHTAVAAAGGVRSFGASSGGVAGFVGRVRDAAPNDAVRSLLTELAVEPLATNDDRRTAHVRTNVARLQELGVARRMSELKSRLQRLNPVEQPEAYNALFGELADLEARRRALREQIVEFGTE